MDSPTEWPVRPGLAIGPIELGMSAADIERIAGEPSSRGTGTRTQVLYFSDITVILNDGSVVQVAAELPSAAFVAGNPSIRVGMPFRELVLHLGEGLEYDEEQALWRLPRTEGILLALARPADPTEEPIDPPYVPELYEVTRPETALVQRIYVE